MAIGARKNQRGLLVLTDQRLFFIWQGMIRHTCESIPLDLMTSVAVGRGLMFSRIKTQGAQSLEEVGQIDKVDAHELAEELRSLISRRGAQRPTAPVAGIPQLAVSASTDPVEALQKIKEMLDLGLITQDDYDRKKRELLGRM